MQNFRGVLRFFFFFETGRSRGTGTPGVPQAAPPAGGGGGGEERGGGPRRRGEGGVGERRALGLSGKPRAARGARARERAPAPAPPLRAAPGRLRARSQGAAGTQVGRWWDAWGS